MSRRQIYDATVDDSDKSFVVPAGVNRHIHYGSVELISTVIAGNRQVAMEIQDASANVVYRSLAGAVQIESLTREYHFAPEPVREAAFVSNQIMVPIPARLILLPGFTVRIYDINAIDAAADDMTVSLMMTDSIETLDNQNPG